MKRCIEGLQEDLEALVLKRADPSVTLYDVLGTMGANLSALHSIHHHLQQGTLDALTQAGEPKEE